MSDAERELTPDEATDALAQAFDQAAAVIARTPAPATVSLSVIDADALRFLLTNAVNDPANEIDDDIAARGILARLNDAIEAAVRS